MVAMVGNNGGPPQQPKLVTALEDAPVVIDATEILSQHGIPRYMYYPDTVDVQEELRLQIECLKNQGVVIGMVSGVFDVMHPNHVRYLQTVYLTLASQAFYQIYGRFLQGSELLDALAQQPDICALVVSVNGDQDVFERKAYSAAKGRGIRPIQSWPQRALNVSMISFDLPNGMRLPVARFVTSHGTDFQETPHRHDVDLGVHLGPDHWFTFNEPGNQTATEIRAAIQAGNLEHSTNIVEIPVLNFETDPFTGLPYSTTGMLSRIQMTEGNNHGVQEG